MENLHKKAFSLYLFELIAVYFLIVLSAQSVNAFDYFMVWYVIIAILNVVSIILLIRFKPKYYIGLIVTATVIIGVPLLFIYMLSNIRMC